MSLLILIICLVFLRGVIAITVMVVGTIVTIISNVGKRRRWARRYR